MGKGGGARFYEVEIFKKKMSGFSTAHSVRVSRPDPQRLKNDAYPSVLSEPIEIRRGDSCGRPDGE